MLILEKNGRFGTSIGPFLSGAALGTIASICTPTSAIS